MRTKHQREALTCVLAAAAVASAACGAATVSSPSANSAASAFRMRLDELAAGRLDTLPTGGQFVRFAVFQQAPGASTASRKHQPGFVYQEQGIQRLAYSTGTIEDISAGTGVFQVSVAHSHANTGSSQNRWYFIALWPSLQRGQPLVGGSTVAFETEDIPSSALQPRAYVETLRRVSLQSGGRTQPRSFSGLEALYVLDGSLTLHVTGRQPADITTGQGAYVAPGTVTQEYAAGSGGVTYLAFFVSPQGQPFETDVSVTP